VADLFLPSTHPQQDPSGTSAPLYTPPTCPSESSVATDAVKPSRPPSLARLVPFQGRQSLISSSTSTDIDAVAHYLHTRTGKKPDLADVSRGVFGAEVGCARLLKVRPSHSSGEQELTSVTTQLFEKKNMKASWYIPGHTIESFPKEMAAIRDAGHEIGLQ
jgi:hypothetical protein